MDVDQPWVKHGVISERGTVCWERTIFSAMPYPYQITIKIIQRVSNNILSMLERKLLPPKCIIELSKHGVPDCYQNDNVKKREAGRTAPIHIRPRSAPVKLDAPPLPDPPHTNWTYSPNTGFAPLSRTAPIHIRPNPHSPPIRPS